MPIASAGVGASHKLCALAMAMNVEMAGNAGLVARVRPGSRFVRRVGVGLDNRPSHTHHTRPEDASRWSRRLPAASLECRAASSFLPRFHENSTTARCSSCSLKRIGPDGVPDQLPLVQIGAIFVNALVISKNVRLPAARYRWTTCTRRRTSARRPVRVEARHRICRHRSTEPGGDRDRPDARRAQPVANNAIAYRFPDPPS